MPADYPALVAYGRRMLDGDELQVGAWARRRARQIVLEPPVPTRMRPVLETVNFIVIALLPDEIRSQYGFAPLPPAFVRRALVRAGARYIRRGVLLPVLPARVRELPAARRACRADRGPSASAERQLTRHALGQRRDQRLGPDAEHVVMGAGGGPDGAEPLAATRRSWSGARCRAPAAGSRRSQTR